MDVQLQNALLVAAEQFRATETALGLALIAKNDAAITKARAEKAAARDRWLAVFIQA